MSVKSKEINSIIGCVLQDDDRPIIQGRLIVRKDMDCALEGSIDHRAGFNEKIDADMKSATFIGGALHSLPFVINDVHRALALAYVVVALELLVIAWVRKRFQSVSLTTSIVQVTLGGAAIAAVGFAFGHG